MKANPKITLEMFEALLKIMDLKIQTQAARDSWDGGLHESGQEMDAIEAFKKEFVDADNDRC